MTLDNIKSSPSEPKLLSDLENQDIVLLVTRNERDDILTKIGYEILENGDLVDKKTGELVEAEDKGHINVDVDKRFILVGGGSHHFVRSVVGYIEYLSDKGELDIQERA